MSSLQATLISAPGPRGPQGNGLRIIGAPPTAAVGIDGDAAHDTVNGQLYWSKSGGTWDLTKKVATTGPVGDAGLTTYAAPTDLFTNYSYVAHPTCGLTTPYAAATGPLPLTHVGTSDVLGEYSPTYASAFLGATLTNYSTTVAQVFTLVNVTTGATVYTSASITGASDGTGISVGPFTASQYPLAANNTYVWMATNASSSANVYCAVTPYYLTPAQGGPVLSNVAMGMYGVAGETITTTYALMYHPGPVTGLRQNFKNPKACYWVNVWCQNLTNTALVFNIGNFTQTVPANTTQNYGPFSPATNVNGAGALNTWVVKTNSGTATGIVAAGLQVASTP